MQQHSTVPGCTEQLAFSLGINCGSNPKKLFLHPSNVSRHVRKPVYQPAGKTKTHFSYFAVDLISILFLYTLSHIQNSFFLLKSTPLPRCPFLPNPAEFPSSPLISFLQAKKRGSTNHCISECLTSVCIPHPVTNTGILQNIPVSKTFVVGTFWSV